ncbi:hypothetical protein PJ15_0902 [Acinetobacter sp. neg1]|uniref:hypothetical protein n=1 Tax=Acinetobacter sp. neg1 TaxID=1561068 RepID=UPI0005443868|nr:hypothetical protein [Acinetobacter sp. neg1]KHF77846.1 hypothetical protein PJ15_0902 [Acinetobacter sp. neg1]
MQYDPRTVARNIPGIFDEIFPQLTPGLVAHFNSFSKDVCEPISPIYLKKTTLKPAMLFELGYAAGEHLIKFAQIDWEKCFLSAIQRQNVFYDAVAPNSLNYIDKEIAEMVGNNIAKVLIQLSSDSHEVINFNPIIPGIEWISTSQGDFSLGNTLIEVKCTNRRFSAADYRQIAMYWLLSYAGSLEKKTEEWEEVILLNPRLGFMVRFNFNNFINVISSGRTKLEIFQLFISIIGTRSMH